MCLFDALPLCKTATHFYDAVFVTLTLIIKRVTAIALSDNMLHP